MRRRKLFTLAAGVSAVLCVGVCVLWLGGYAVEPVVLRNGVGSFTTGRLQDRCVVIDHYHFARPPGPLYVVYGVSGHARAGRAIKPYPPSGVAGPAGFGFARSAPAMDCSTDFHSQIGTADVASVPLWGVGVAFAVLPVARLWTAARRRPSRTPGRCPACGYDLRATRGRCPECGAVPAGATPVTTPPPPSRG